MMNPLDVIGTACCEIADGILITGAKLYAEGAYRMSTIGVKNHKPNKNERRFDDRVPTNPPKAEATNPSASQPTNPTPPKAENPTNVVANPEPKVKPVNPPKPKVEVVHNNVQESSGGEDIVADTPIAAAMASNPVFSYDPRYGNRPTLDLRCNIDYGASNPPSPPNNLFSQNVATGMPNNQHTNPQTQMTSDAIIPDMSQNICCEQPTNVADSQPVQQSAPQQVQRVYSVPQQVIYTPYVQPTIPFPIQNGSQQYQHKVDEPPKQKPVVLPKDDTQISNLDDHTKGVIDNIATVAPDPEKKTINVVMPGAIEKGERPVEKTGPDPVKSKVDNREMIRKYPVLKEIEKISLDSGYQIGFLNHVACPDIICCVIAGENGIPIEGKGFMIDINGNVIDRRKKIFPVLSKYVENLNAYHLYAKSDNNDKKGKKAEKDKLNVDLIRDLIIGGPAAVKRRPMYDSSIVTLNMYVDLSTTPRQNISNEDRDYIHGTLNRLRDKVFADIFRNFNYAIAPFRFKIAEYDKETKGILLDTYGCSPFYGQPPVPNASRVQVIIVNGHAYTRWEESELIGKLKDFHPDAYNQNAT